MCPGHTKLLPLLSTRMAIVLAAMDGNIISVWSPHHNENVYYFLALWYSTVVLPAPSVLYLVPGNLPAQLGPGTGTACTGSGNLLPVVIYWLTRPV